MTIFVEDLNIIKELIYFGPDIDKIKIACNIAGFNWLVDFEGDLYIARDPACEEFIEVEVPNGD